MEKEEMDEAARKANLVAPDVLNARIEKIEAAIDNIFNNLNLLAAALKAISGNVSVLVTEREARRITPNLLTTSPSQAPSTITV